METFNYSNYQLEEKTTISYETYSGVFKKCKKDILETELESKPFKIRLIYADGNNGRKLMESRLLEGDFNDEQIIELIESL